MSLFLHYTVLTTVCGSLTLSFFFKFVHRLNLKKTALRQPEMLLPSGKEASNPVDSVDEAILSHWAP